MKEDAPILYLIGGPNGAGKTTFAREFLPMVGVMEFLNADSLAAGLAPLHPASAGARAARLLLRRWRELVTERRTFGFESTLSGRTYANLIRQAKAQGYRLHLCYLHLATVRHSIRRVRERVKKGGHDVPLADLHRRFLPSLRNFFRLYLPLADHAVLYDSTLQPPQLVAEWHSPEVRILKASRHETILKRLD
jgi:predicted ABC-type ATPase